MADATKQDAPEPSGSQTGRPAGGPAAEGKSTGGATPVAAAKPAPKPAAPPPGPPDPPPPPEVPLPAFLEVLTTALGPQEISYWVGDWTVIVPAGRLIDVARVLRDEPAAAFDFCSDVTASDWPTRAERFEVIYCLYSTRHRHRVRMKVRAADGEAVPSVTGVWPAANWLEREVFDMFGVRFAGHPDLRRILMPDEWQGHPQRKDYPLEGPGEFLIEDPLEWLKLRRAADEAGLP